METIKKNPSEMKFTLTERVIYNNIVEGKNQIYKYLIPKYCLNIIIKLEAPMHKIRALGRGVTSALPACSPTHLGDV